jgi:hypothetical protein
MRGYASVCEWLKRGFAAAHIHNHDRRSCGVRQQLAAMQGSRATVLLFDRRAWQVCQRVQRRNLHAGVRLGLQAGHCNARQGGGRDRVGLKRGTEMQAAAVTCAGDWKSAVLNPRHNRVRALTVEVRRVPLAVHATSSGDLASMQLCTPRPRPLCLVLPPAVDTSTMLRDHAPTYALLPPHQPCG